MADILQQVITYNDSSLARLLNSNAAIECSNKKFLHFNDTAPMNLGASVSFDIPPRMTANDSLVASFQDVEQRVQTLTLNQAKTVAFDFTQEQFILNVRDYMDRFGNAAIAQLGALVEANVLENFESNTYRFYDGVTTPITTPLQLANALAQFRTVGTVRTDTKGIMGDTMWPAVYNAMQNQFTPKRNDEVANSWEYGNWNQCDWYSSNMLKTHLAGTEGVAGTTLTVVSTTANAQGGVTSITFSGTTSATDADSIKAFDLLQFNDGVSGQTDVRFLTNYGGVATPARAQFSASADAASTGASEVTVTLTNPLQAAAGRNQNINTEIVAGMTVSVMPSHRCAGIMSGKPLFLAMPKLPSESPFESSVKTDESTGVTLKMAYGSLYGQNQRGILYQCLWGSTMVPDYAMRVCLPL